MLLKIRENGQPTSIIKGIIKKEQKLHKYISSYFPFVFCLRNCLRNRVLEPLKQVSNYEVL